jgi:hypothetical protein
VANWGAWVSLYACASLGASHGLMDLGGHTLMLPPVMLWKDIFNFMAGRLPSFLTLLHALWMIHSIEVYFYEVASDRWMDDVCRVCPLCRGNVCEPKAVDTGVETALETWSTLITYGSCRYCTRNTTPVFYPSSFWYLCLLYILSQFHGMLKLLIINA